MSITMRLRQARNPEQVAAEIEPLAVALASLADETTEVLTQLQASSQEQAATWSKAQQEAAEAWKQAAAETSKAAKQAGETMAKLEEAASGQTWRTIWLCAGMSLLSAMLASVLSLWLAPPAEIRNQLDPSAVAEHLRPAIIEALRRK